MTEAIAVRELPSAMTRRIEPEIVPLDRENLTFFAMMLQSAGLIPAEKEGGRELPAEIAKFRAMAKIVAGTSYGFDVVLAQTCFDIIGGKLQMNAKAQGILFRDNGEYDLRIKQHDKDGCRVVVLRFLDGQWCKIGEVEFTREMAAKAGLLTGPNKHNWEKYFMDMCFARVMTRVVKRFNPGCLRPRLIMGNHFAKQAPAPPVPVAEPEQIAETSAVQSAPETYKDDPYTEADGVADIEGDEIEGEVIETTPEPIAAENVSTVTTDAEEATVFDEIMAQVELKVRAAGGADKLSNDLRREYKAIKTIDQAQAFLDQF